MDHLREREAAARQALQAALSERKPLDEIATLRAEWHAAKAALAEEQERADAEAEVAAADAADATPDPDPVDEPVDEPVDVKAGAKVHTTLSTPAPTTPLPERRQSVISEHLVAVDGVSGKNAGDGFTSWLELADAMHTKAKNIRSNSSEKFTVGRVDVSELYPAERRMSDKPVDNLRLFEREEIMAALCAPLPPLYDLACMNSTARPVRASLPTYRAPRGGVKVYPSPTLQDITTGTGIWTYLDDANEAAVKEACATIACATPVDYRWYGIYRCITIKNMLAMTFPELVEAYLNRLGAAFARMAEVQVLEAMAAETDTITAHTLGYNASVSITSTILNYLALYREQQRWDDQEFDAWMPRWIVPALQADQIRRRNTNGDVLRVPSEAQIRQVFVDAGVTPHFFLDTPSWATPIPQLQVNGVLGWFTRNLEMIIAPRGKFALMDAGTLDIGVTGDSIYRDNVSNSKNQFTMFWESFEGVVNLDSCPAHLLVMDDLCFNGQQIADIVVNCEGGDEVGAAS